MPNDTEIDADLTGRLHQLEQYSVAIFGVAPQASDYLVLGLASLGAIWFYSRKLLDSPKTSLQLRIPPVATRNQSRDIVQVSADAGKNCVVFFGSQSGTAEDYASRIAKEGKARFGLQTMVADLSNYNYDTLDQYPSDKMCIFILATYGEGEPTDNATGFYEHIERGESVFSRSLDPPLKNLQFAIFGLGNSTYKNYNAMVKKVTASLSHHGASQIGPAGEGDDGKRTLEEDFLEWKEAMWNRVAMKMNLKEQLATYEPAFQVTERQSHSPPYSSEVFLGELDEGKGGSNSYYLATVTYSEQLLSSSDRTCIHIDLDICESNMSYEAGDHITIWPMNSNEEVDQFLCVFGLQEKRHSIVDITPVEATATVPFPTPTTYEAIARYYLEINAAVSRQLLESLASFAPSSEAKKEMNRLGKDKEYFYSQTTAAYYNISRLLQKVGGGETWQVPFSMLVEGLHRLKPRYYSVSSSPATQPRTISITAAVEEQRTPDLGYTFRGVATNYLMALQSTQSQETNASPDRYAIKGPRDTYFNFKVPVRVCRSNFRLPTVHSKPIIMIGAGTGIAPFRGFVQERAAQEDSTASQCGAMMLFFGCRHPEQDFLYRSEWEVNRKRHHQELPPICC
jgi:NADPH-ferrihemoprotein reductase